MAAYIDECSVYVGRVVVGPRLWVQAHSGVAEDADIAVAVVRVVVVLIDLLHVLACVGEVFKGEVLFVQFL